VYKHTSGSLLGGKKQLFNKKPTLLFPTQLLFLGHAVKIIGWGVLNGEKYWEVCSKIPNLCLQEAKLIKLCFFFPRSPTLGGQ
jgi:hypothetical protein